MIKDTLNIGLVELLNRCAGSISGITGQAW